MTKFDIINKQYNFSKFFIIFKKCFPFKIKENFFYKKPNFSLTEKYVLLINFSNNKQKQI